MEMVNYSDTGLLLDKGGVLMYTMLSRGMSGPPTPGQRIFSSFLGGRIPRAYQARHINPPAETMGGESR